MRGTGCFFLFFLILFIYNSVAKLPSYDSDVQVRYESLKRLYDLRDTMGLTAAQLTALREKSRLVMLEKSILGDFENDSNEFFSQENHREGLQDLYSEDELKALRETMRQRYLANESKGSVFDDSSVFNLEERNKLIELRQIISSLDRNKLDSDAFFTEKVADEGMKVAASQGRKTRVVVCLYPDEGSKFYEESVKNCQRAREKLLFWYGD